jgi:predicted kinase
MKVRCEGYRGEKCRDLNCAHRLVHIQRDECANHCATYKVGICVPYTTKDANKPEMIILSGMSGSGKNTWLANNPDIRKKYTIIELDWIRREIYGHIFHSNAEPFVLGTAKAMARMLLEQGKNVLINSTAVALSIRKDWVKMAKEYNYKTKIIYFDTPYEVCYDRNNTRTTNRVSEEAMTRMKHMLYAESPSKASDTADEIQVIKYKKEK